MAGAAHRAGAQVFQAAPPTPAQCIADVAALSAHPSDAVFTTSAQACGAAGGGAISGVIARSHRQSDADFLSQLTVVARLIQDGTVYATALDLARDQAATPAARGAGLLILLGQYSLNISLAQPTGTLLAGGVPVSCSIRADESISHFSSPVPLPPHFAENAQTAASAIASDTTAPALVSGIAKCVAAMLPQPAGQLPHW